MIEPDDPDPRFGPPPDNHQRVHVEPEAPLDPDSVLPEPAGWTDALTGTEGPRYWDRLIAGEQARLRRYRRKVTVVLIELSGFEEAAVWIGREAALRKFAELSRVLASDVRSSDHIARIGRGSFGLVLVETNELEALNFIDRILRHLQAEAADEGYDIQIGVGWASPEPRDELTAAITTAEERLATDFFHTR